MNAEGCVFNYVIFNSIGSVPFSLNLGEIVSHKFKDNEKKVTFEKIRTVHQTQKALNIYVMSSDLTLTKKSEDNDTKTTRCENSDFVKV